MGTILLDTLAAVFGFLNTVGIIRIAIVAVVLWGGWLGLARTRIDAAARLRTWLAIALPLTLWFVGVWVLAASGAFAPRPGPPIIPLAIVIPLAVGLSLLLRSKRIGAMLDALPAHWLVALQVYRVVGATFLVQWGLGNLSAAFALPAGTGDFLVGALAIPAALYLRRGTALARAAAVGWNLLGILDLLLALSLGFLSQTGRLPPSPLGYPLVMIPVFVVPLSLLLHAVSLRQLRRRGRLASSGPLPLAAPAAE